MNKKHLSVVMAGAMLATSVAPVLAAEETKVPEYTLAGDQKGLLIEALRNLMNSEKFVDGNLAGKSVYGYSVGNSKIVNYDTLFLKSDIKKLAKGETITVYKHQTATNKYGELTSMAQEDIVVKGEAPVYDVKELEALANRLETNPTDIEKAFIQKAVFDKDAKTVTLTLTKVAEGGLAGDDVKYEELVLSEGDVELNFNMAFAANGRKLVENGVAVSDAAQRFDRFEEVAGKDTITIKKGDELPADKMAVVKIAEDAADPAVRDTYLVEDLFDGLLLTAKGDELADAIADKDADVQYNLVRESNSGNVKITDTFGVLSFEIDVKDKKDSKNDKTITVRGLDKDQMNLLISYLDGDKQAEILAGANRYETAVAIAREQADITAVAKNKQIVLVNGEALVDGLAAAPYAASLGKAPVLLTDANGLPKATKDYLKELVAKVPVGKLKDVKINLVGGEAVLSESLVRELEAYGFTVNRIGGNNREETSLKVAKEIKGAKEAFVVGANGEADAMSIAPVAAEKVAPIIVTKSDKGLSKDGLYAVKDLKIKDVTVIGGEAVVPAATENAIEEMKIDNEVVRVSGANRRDTNAAIIKAFYADDQVNAVMVASDGQANKSELVDALTAANLAVQKKAPIVLAKNDLSKEQINQLNLNAPYATNLYQLGGSVNRTVLDKVAQLLNIPKAR